MAVGNLVMLAVNPGTRTAMPRGPLLGRVVNEAAGPPATADVQWFNGKRTDAIDQSNLWLATDPPANLLPLVGKWAQLVQYSPPSLAVAGDAPKSPAAAGLVHSVYTVDIYSGGEGAIGIVAFIAPADARVPWLCVIIDVDDDASSQLSTHIQHRTIGRD